MKELEILTYRPTKYGEFGLGDRHGSYEVTWGRKDDNGLTRFVTVSVTPPPADEATLHRVEVWAGATSEDRFARYLVFYWDGLTTPRLEDDAKIKTAIKAAIEEARNRADGLPPSDLTHTMESRAQPDQAKLEELSTVLGTAPKGRDAEPDYPESGRSQ